MVRRMTVSKAVTLLAIRADRKQFFHCIAFLEGARYFGGIDTINLFWINLPVVLLNYM
jgi:hypothetical protein